MLKKPVFFNVNLKILSFLFYSIWGVFLSRTFTIPRTAGRVSINSFLPLPPASQTLRHQPGGYCREVTSAHQQSDSNTESSIFGRKSLTTKNWSIPQHISACSIKISIPAVVDETRTFQRHSFAKTQKEHLTFLGSDSLLFSVP